MKKFGIEDIQSKLHDVGVPAELESRNVLTVASKEQYFDKETISFEVWLEGDGTITLKPRGKVQDFMSLSRFWYKQSGKVAKKHNKELEG